MNLSIVIPILAVMLLLRWRGAGMLVWLFTWWIAAWLFFNYGFVTPIPQSVVMLYMGITTFVLILYVTSDRSRLDQVKGPLFRFITEKRFTVPLILAIVAIPSLVAARVYLGMTQPVQAPFFARTVHPATPAGLTVHETEYDMSTLDNPLRPLEQSDPASFARHLANGRQTYYQNCVFCHGDNMTGNGIYAHGLNPIPTNFADPGTIAMLQESYLFWRISKGAPGLPEEGGPWESAMPVWENFLSEEEIWEVILFLYDYTGQRPRARGEEVAE